MSAMQVLVAEDKVNLARALSRALQTQGHVVELAHDGCEALAKGRRDGLQAIVMDLMLPRMDGLSVIRRLREEQVRTPILILSARDSMSEIVQGLDCGADDYITKPFALDIFLARVRAAGRRGASAEPCELHYQDLKLFPETLRLQRGERCADLTRTEFAILEKLVRRAGLIVPREVLLEQGWAPDAEITEASLYVFISSLRAKLTQSGESELLHTVRGVGYSLRALP